MAPPYDVTVMNWYTHHKTSIWGRWLETSSFFSEKWIFEFHGKCHTFPGTSDLGYIRNLRKLNQICWSGLGAVFVKCSTIAYKFRNTLLVIHHSVANNWIKARFLPTCLSTTLTNERWRDIYNVFSHYLCKPLVKNGFKEVVGRDRWIPRTKGQ